MKAIYTPAELASLPLPTIAERHKVHLINPASGSHRKADRIIQMIRSKIEGTDAEVIVSKHPGDIEALAKKACLDDPYAHIIIYGGDGTVYEAINGIIDSLCSATVSFSVIPMGSGNDFSAYANDSDIFEKAELNQIDAIHVYCANRESYYVNMMNIGFDCSVVRETYSLKKNPLFHGNAAYIAGVVKTLISKKPTEAKITLTGVAESTDDKLLTSPMGSVTIEKSLLLTAAANSQFCGGGFRAAPRASITDGLIDVLLVNDISRRKFISLVGDYRSGSYIGKDGKLIPSYNNILTYVKCKGFEIEGADAFCLDGEVFPTRGAKVSANVVPKALWFAAL